MSRTNAAENDYLLLLFNNVAWANVGDGSGLQPSAAPGSFHISLHTADPGEGGDQDTNEAAYTSYARVAVARTAAGWAVVGNNVDNAASITFPIATGGSASIRYVGIGTDAGTGAGNLLWSFALDSPLVVSAGVTPDFGVAELNVVVD